ncbi:hypothetical protein ZWY2020_025384 [Hordeum vulgare]|nr:hypothetical protein ZWY2020_025384 [Hordeum vulgare]
MESNPLRGLFGVGSPRPKTRGVVPQPAEPTKHVYYSSISSSESRASSKSCTMSSIPVPCSSVRRRTTSALQGLARAPQKRDLEEKLWRYVPKPMLPTMSASSLNSECFESSVPELDNQIDRDPLPSPPSPSSSILSHFLPLHDVKEPDSNKDINVVQKYDYLPQGSIGMGHLPRRTTLAE